MAWAAAWVAWAAWVAGRYDVMRSRIEAGVARSKLPATSDQGPRRGRSHALLDDSARAAQVRSGARPAWRLSGLRLLGPRHRSIPTSRRSTSRSSARSRSAATFNFSSPSWSSRRSSSGRRTRSSARPRRPTRSSKGRSTSPTRTWSSRTRSTCPAQLNALGPGDRDAGPTTRRSRQERTAAAVDRRRDGQLRPRSRRDRR